MSCHEPVARFLHSAGAVFKGLPMYKIEMDISAWGGNEKLTIETFDFDKIEIIREFIEFQQDNGWAADYEQVLEFDDEEELEEEMEEEMEEDDEPSTISTYLVTKIED